MTATNLAVPYSQKDEAKALGAKWDAPRKAWCVPPGALLAPFERWLPSLAPAKARPRVDSYIGKRIVGANYIELAHNCNPFEECDVCRAELVASGWIAARDAARMWQA